MSNGEVCCILGVCCPPASRRVKLISALETDAALGRDEADRAADWIIEHITPEKMLLAIKSELAKRSEK